MKKFIFHHIAILTVISTLTGCATSVPTDPALASIDSSHLPVPNLSINISGLSPCTTTKNSEIHLNSHYPVNIIVHGCFGSAARYRALAQVFAFHGQQTVCFNYNDRDSLMKSSSELIDAISELNAKMENRQMTVIGHSQGGLIARKALVKERHDKSIAGDTSLRLVTISAPYAGISAADHCASSTARILSLGLVVPICKIISGDKWYEITQPSPFIQKPGELLDLVSSHLKIITDETGTCRKYSENGICIKDDFVFSVKEQYFEYIDASSRVENIEVSAGHSEIVGDYRIIPTKLIRLLQSKRILRNTPQAQEESLSRLLSRLYLH